tara:strand:- start:163 stop:540 length:378 start_codon:yes stop_codon:yes gene_type:complete
MKTGTNISKLPEPTATLTLTYTMLDKSIIDANASVRKFALYLGVDYSKMSEGEKRVVNAKLFGHGDCKVTFYKAKTRGDRRVSISNLKKTADVGDTVAITIIDGVIVVNLTKDNDAFLDSYEAVL